MSDHKDKSTEPSLGDFHKGQANIPAAAQVLLDEAILHKQNPDNNQLSLLSRLYLLLKNVVVANRGPFALAAATTALITTQLPLLAAVVAAAPVAVVAGIFVACFAAAKLLQCARVAFNRYCFNQYFNQENDAGEQKVPLMAKSEVDAYLQGIKAGQYDSEYAKSFFMYNAFRRPMAYGAGEHTAQLNQPNYTPKPGG